MLTRILLDCGHGPGNGRGGRFDPGAVANGRTEHELVVSVADRLPALLPPSLSLYRLPELPLRESVRWVNERALYGDVLLSLHMNSFKSPVATGVEVVVSAVAPSIRREQARVLAEVLSERLGIRNRGVILDTETPKGMLKGLPIVRDTTCPAFLLELGFISNPSDLAAVDSRGAEAIRDAVLTLNLREDL